MTITRYTNRVPVFTTPWRELDELLSNKLGRRVDENWSSTTTGGEWSPAVDVQETKEELVLTAELPGLTEADVEIELENNVLTLRGEKTEMKDVESEDSRTHVWERTYGSFTRSFSLPRSIQSDAIEATFKHGLLTIRMPKVAEAKGRKIEVKTEV